MSCIRQVVDTVSIPLHPHSRKEKDIFRYELPTHLIQEEPNRDRLVALWTNEFHTAVRTLCRSQKPSSVGFSILIRGRKHMRNLKFQSGMRELCRDFSRRTENVQVDFVVNDGDVPSSSKASASAVTALNSPIGRTGTRAKRNSKSHGEGGGGKVGRARDHLPRRQAMQYTIRITRFSPVVDSDRNAPACGAEVPPSQLTQDPTPEPEAVLVGTVDEADRITWMTTTTTEARTFDNVIPSVPALVVTILSQNDNTGPLRDGFPLEGGWQQPLQQQQESGGVASTTDVVPIGDGDEWYCDHHRTAAAPLALVDITSDDENVGENDDDAELVAGNDEDDDDDGSAIVGCTGRLLSSPRRGSQQARSPCGSDDDASSSSRISKSTSHRMRTTTIATTALKRMQELESIRPYLTEQEYQDKRQDILNQI